MLDAGEILTEIVLPRALEGSKGSYRKVRARGAWDFALAGLASSIVVKSGKVEKARLVLAGVAPIPVADPGGGETDHGQAPR